MDKLKSLRRLAKSSGSVNQFFLEIKKWPKTYGIPLWSKLDYEKVYIEVKGRV